jgi:hypothetical protein
MSHRFRISLETSFLQNLVNYAYISQSAQRSGIYGGAFYSAAINCIQQLHTSGEHKVLSWRSNNYNISFKIQYPTGPMFIAISYQVGTTSKTLAMSHQLLVIIESGLMLHPHTPPAEDTLLLSIGTSKLNKYNMVQMSVSELYHLDYGIDYMIVITLKSSLYCSNGQLILKRNAVPCMHHQHLKHHAIAVTKYAHNQTCTEILKTRFFKGLLSYVTEIYINSASIGYGTFIKIDNLVVNKQRWHKPCHVNETIILSEWHSEKDIIYRYSFFNTSINTVTWSSQFDSDIHLLITKNATFLHHGCPSHTKVIDVTYRSAIRKYFHLNKPHVAKFNYIPAR